MRVLAIASSLAFIAPGLVSSQTPFAQLAPFNRLAQDAANDFNNNYGGDGTRRLLNSVSSADFNDFLCATFTDSYMQRQPVSASCNCSSPSKYSITCATPYSCSLDPDCEGICGVTTLITEFEESNGTRSDHSDRHSLFDLSIPWA